MKDYERFKEDCLYSLEGMTGLYLSNVMGNVLSDRIRHQLTTYYEALIIAVYEGKRSGRDLSKRINYIHYRLIGYVKALTDLDYAKKQLYRLAKSSISIINKELI